MFRNYKKENAQLRERIAEQHQILNKQETFMAGLEAGTLTERIAQQEIALHEKQTENEALKAQLGEAWAKAEEMALRYDRLDATLGKVQDERDTAEAKARQAQEAMEGAIKDTTYWRHQYEAAVKRAQELQGRLDEKEVVDSGTARHRKPGTMTPMEQQAFCEIKKLEWQMAEKDRENQRLRARLDQLGAG